MQRFSNILVVVDEKTENKAVVERAVTLAQRNQARVTVVNTVSESPRQAPRPFAPELPADDPGQGLDIIEEWPPNAGLQTKLEPPATVHESLTEWVREDQMPVTEPAVEIREYIVAKESQRLDQWVDFIRQNRVQASGKMLYGTPFLEIIREVLRNEHDLVMTTAEGRTGLKEKLFGSTTMHLMRKCPCPVWVVKPSPPERYTHILAAVDPNPLDEVQHALNIKIMDLATSLTRREQGELVVVHTWAFPVEGALRSAHFMQSSEVDGWVHDVRNQHRRRLAELLRPYAFADLKHQVYLLKGAPGRLIPELAADKNVELIVMGTVSRTGVAGLFIGNAAEKILRKVDCSVLAVKPDGFKTPVRLDE